MAWRGPPYGFRRQFDEIMAEMQRRFDEMMTGLGEFGQQAGRQAGRMLPALRSAEMHVDVREHGDEVMVVADLPGVEREDISIRLLDPRTLHLATRRERTVAQEEGGYYLRERTYGAMSRTILLPAEVAEEGAQATFRNGVLEVRLKKTPEARGKEIPLA
ncbi:MAG: Hsp20/alpha crystallin family protein [Methanomicrobiales archaeon]|nr:Hsp20/alpha crystallin family protein [Methanomicrobiales archaeon]MDI6875476.1 Hsp20/alpha crystallin family protein [Methanomicrobiales archaeon]